MFTLLNTFASIMRKIPESKTNAAKRLFELRYSTRQVAQELDISNATAARILKENKENVPHNPGGRPRKMNDELVNHLKLNLKRGILKTAVDATKEANTMLEEPVSRQTVCRRLVEVQMKFKRKRKQPLLRPRHKADRMKFVRKYNQWTHLDWKRVIFTDESKINRICSDGLQGVWVDESGEQDARAVEGTLKFGGGSIMVWGCMSWYGTGRLIKIDGTMDSQQYIRILREGLERSIEDWGMNRNDIVLQQDNDPKHTSRATKTYMESVHISEAEETLLFWPAQSADLNPIENLWSILKVRLGKDPNTRLLSLNDLWEKVQEEWASITVEECQKLIQSMPRRIDAVRNAKGGNTKY
jgi:transposase